MARSGLQEIVGPREERERRALPFTHGERFPRIRSTRRTHDEHVHAGIEREWHPERAVAELDVVTRGPCAGHGAVERERHGGDARLERRELLPRVGHAEVGARLRDRAW